MSGRLSTSTLCNRRIEPCVASVGFFYLFFRVVLSPGFGERRMDGATCSHAWGEVAAKHTQKKRKKKGVCIPRNWSERSPSFIHFRPFPLVSFGYRTWRRDRSINEAWGKGNINTNRWGKRQRSLPFEPFRKLQAALTHTHSSASIFSTSPSV